MLHNPPSVQHLFAQVVEVFSGNCPVAWTDLDLSGTVGTGRRLVTLKWIGTANTECAFRTEGDTDDFYSAAVSGDGVVYLKMAAAAMVHRVAIVMTNALGVIQWKANQATAATIDTIGWVA